MSNRKERKAQKERETIKEEINSPIEKIEKVAPNQLDLEQQAQQLTMEQAAEKIEEKFPAENDEESWETVDIGQFDFWSFEKGHKNYVSEVFTGYFHGFCEENEHSSKPIETLSGIKMKDKEGNLFVLPKYAILTKALEEMEAQNVDFSKRVLRFTYLERNKLDNGKEIVKFNIQYSDRK